jgi:hypothetical protein
MLQLQKGRLDDDVRKNDKYLKYMKNGHCVAAFPLTTLLVREKSPFKKKS